MPEKKNERAKLYVVIGLALVLAVVAYFRFAHKKKVTPAVARTPLPAATLRLDIPQIKIPHRQDAQLHKSAAKEAMRTFIKDIFVPSTAPNAEVRFPDQESLKPVPCLKLKGTIVGGENAIAVINDEFVHTGDRIGEYRVVRISEGEVLLMSDIHQMVLKVLEGVP